MIYVTGCKCSKNLLAPMNDGSCWWCGHGEVRTPRQMLERRCLRRLPRDLGSLVREGRRADPFCENVVTPWALTLIRQMPPPTPLEVEAL